MGRVAAARCPLAHITQPFESRARDPGRRPEQQTEEWIVQAPASVRSYQSWQATHVPRTIVVVLRRFSADCTIAQPSRRASTADIPSSNHTIGVSPLACAGGAAVSPRALADASDLPNHWISREAL